MSKNQAYTPPTVATVSTAGNLMETIGYVVTAIGIIGIFLVMFLSASPLVAALLPVGLLTLIAANSKRTADATAALYLLNYQEVMANSDPAEHQA